MDVSRKDKLELTKEFNKLFSEIYLYGYNKALKEIEEKSDILNHTRLGFIRKSSLFDLIDYFQKNNIRVNEQIFDRDEWMNWFLDKIEDK